MVRSGACPWTPATRFLVEMTDEVAELCLQATIIYNRSSLSLSPAARHGRFARSRRFHDEHGGHGRTQPADRISARRRNASRARCGGQALTRPELAVLLAYAKLTLYAELLSSPVPDDPYLAKELYRYFPETLRARYPEPWTDHRLRREVIATVLSNAMINRGGPAFVSHADLGHRRRCTGACLCLCGGARRLWSAGSQCRDRCARHQRYRARPNWRFMRKSSRSRSPRPSGSCAMSGLRVGCPI